MLDYRKFQTLHFFRFLGDALFYAFLTLYFQSLGFSNLELGTLLAIIPLMAIFGSIVLSKISGNPKRNMLMLKVVNVIEAVAMIFFGFIKSFPLLLLFDVIVSFSNKAFYSLLEASSMDVSEKAKRNYSNIRIFGSIAYLISSFAGGYLIDWLNYKYVFMIAGALFLVAGIFMFTVKTDKASEIEEGEKVHLLSLFKDKNYIFYLVFYMLALGASNVSDNIYSLYVKSLGMSETNYGMVFALMVAFEILAMFVVTKFCPKKFYKYILIGSTILIVLRNLLFAIPMPLVALAILASLRGIAWGAMLATHLNYLRTFIDSKHLTKSIFLLNIFLQIFNTIFNQFGPSISSVSYSLMFGILSTSALIGLVFIFLVKPKPLESDEKVQV